MKNMFSWVVTVAFLFFATMAAAENDEMLTVQQYQEDLQYLVQVIKHANPQIVSLQQLMGYDLLAELDRVGTEAETPEAFGRKVATILNLCIDGHASVVHPWFFRDTYERMPPVEQERVLEYIDTTCYTQAEKAWNIHRENKYIDAPEGYLPQIQLTYFEGAYRTMLPMRKKYRGQSLPAGLQLEAINNKPIHELVNEQLANFDNLQWDRENERWYSSVPMEFYQFSRNDTLQCTFKTPEGESFSMGLPIREKPHKNEHFLSISFNAVTYFSNENLLYVRLISMAKWNELEKDLLKVIERGKPVDKVVIDIRNNRGGSDMVWYRLLKLLIEKPIKPELQYGFLPALQKVSYTPYGISFQKEEQVSFLGNQKIQFYADTLLRKIRPDERSLGYNGPIYVVQNKDIFSSAGALSTLCDYSGQLVSVGQPSDRIAGMGVTPNFFMLPNSKLIFRLDLGLDLTRAQQPEDLLNQVEIEIPTTLPYLMRCKRHWGRIYSKRFLRKHDPVFQRVLEL